MNLKENIVADLIHQFKKLKTEPKAGFVTSDAHKVNRAKLLKAISELDDAAVFSEQPSFTAWFMSSFISKPVAVSFSVLVFVVGSMSTVSAATESLPGDTLYSVKRITEQAQLKLAALDRRAVLHTEFAERRLKEASELQKDHINNPQYLTLAKVAMNEYAAELSLASADLQELQKTSPAAQTLAVVNTVQERIDAMETVIDASVASSITVEEGQDALAAKEVVKDVSDTATRVAVGVHEEKASALTGEEMKEMFKKTLGEIEARQTFDSHRLETIQNKLLNPELADLYKGVAGLPGRDDLKRMAYIITQTELQIPEAMSRFAAGGFRSAFETLQGIDTELLALEARLAEVEIIIMNVKPVVPVEEPVVEEGLPVSSEDELVQ